MNKFYFRSLQILRAVAFLTIFFSHCPIIDSYYSRWGVCVFFVLSGFLNAFHGFNRDVPCSFGFCFRYAVEKIRKLYPLHVIMVFIAFILYTVSTFQSFQLEPYKNIIISIFSLLTNILLISNWIPQEGVLGEIFQDYNIVTWYLSAIVLFYFLTPLFINALKRFYLANGLSSIRKMIIAILGVYIFIILENYAFLCFLGEKNVSWYVYKNPASRIGDYLIGVILGFIFVIENQEKTRKKSNYFCLVILLGSIIISIIQRYSCYSLLPAESRWIISSGFFFTIPVAGMIFGLAELEQNYSFYCSKNFILVILEKLGSLSSYTYLIHVPAINFVHAIYKRISEVNLYVWAVMSFILTLIVATIFRNMLNQYKYPDGYKSKC